MPVRSRRPRLTSRVRSRSSMSRRSLVMRRRMCWRSTSIFVSPGPRVPMPPPEPGHRLAPAAEPGQQVVELRQLDLGLALPRPGVQREDVEDQRRAVDHLHPEPLLQVAELPRRQLVVEDHRLRVRRVDEVVDLLDLALADERGRVGRGPRLDHPGDRLRAGRARQGGELVERLLVCAAADDAGERRPARRPTAASGRRAGTRNRGRVAGARLSAAAPGCVPWPPAAGRRGP